MNNSQEERKRIAHALDRLTGCIAGLQLALKDEQSPIGHEAVQALTQTAIEIATHAAVADTLLLHGEPQKSLGPIWKLPYGPSDLAPLSEPKTVTLPHFMVVDKAKRPPKVGDAVKRLFQSLNGRHFSEWQEYERTIRIVRGDFGLRFVSVDDLHELAVAQGWVKSKGQSLTVDVTMTVDSD